MKLSRQTAKIDRTSYLNEPPKEWFLESEKKLTGYQACPDLAFRSPLPFNAVGEVKLFKAGSPQKAMAEFYNDIRQAVFYLGAFAGEYTNAILIIADSSPGHSFRKGMELLNPSLLELFGAETNIFLCPIFLK